ncbi:MAG: 4-hydroxybutyrate CoA-transferase, partial [Eudoraea sp.]
MKIVTAAEAAAIVKSGDRIFLQGAAMTPNTLINSICERYEELEQVEIISIHTEGEVKYAFPPYNQAFNINSCFVGGNVRRAVNTNKGDYIPIFLSEIHFLFRRNILPLDVAVVQVSPPD